MTDSEVDTEIQDSDSYSDTEAFLNSVPVFNHSGEGPSGSYSDQVVALSTNKFLPDMDSQLRTEGTSISLSRENHNGRNTETSKPGEVSKPTDITSAVTIDNDTIILHEITDDIDGDKLEQLVEIETPSAAKSIETAHDGQLEYRLVQIVSFTCDARTKIEISRDVADDVLSFLFLATMFLKPVNLASGVNKWAPIMAAQDEGEHKLWNEALRALTKAEAKCWEISNSSSFDLRVRATLYAEWHDSMRTDILSKLEGLEAKHRVLFRSETHSQETLVKQWHNRLDEAMQPYATQRLHVLRCDVYQGLMRRCIDSASRRRLNPVPFLQTYHEIQDELKVMIQRLATIPLLKSDADNITIRLELNDDMRDMSEAVSHMTLDKGWCWEDIRGKHTSKRGWTRITFTINKLGRYIISRESDDCD